MVQIKLRIILHNSNIVSTVHLCYNRTNQRDAVGDDKTIMDAVGKSPLFDGTEGANQRFRNAGESLR
jgi:hypothetical protein